MISYITSRKKTIVPSQSLDSVQQQHACKVVRKFFILSKKSLYRPQNYNNNPQKPNNPQQKNFPVCRAPNRQKELYLWVINHNTFNITSCDFEKKREEILICGI